MCMQNPIQKVTYPRGKDSSLSFFDKKNAFKKLLKVPFVCFADFECFLKQVKSDVTNEEVDTKTGLVNSSQEQQVFRVHEPASFVYKIIGQDEEYDRELEIYPKTEEDILDERNPAEVFIDSIIKDANSIYDEHISVVKPMRNLTTEELDSFDKSFCHICEKEINDSDDVHLDHCHITSEPRGYAHGSCNLKYKINKETW